ncbi:MAG: mechanosensitive ion channel, partial [Mollicutes bacterium]|nr:mechanosensitive ion channel [Mollicutes bacterium]
METQETKKMEKQGKAKFSLKQWWKAKTRAKKVTLAVEVLFFLISIAVGLILVYCRQIFGNETGDAILGKGIENGWIWIGERLGNSGIQWLLTFLVVVIAFMFVFVFTAIVRACTSNGRKAQTVGSLICSLIKYISILVGVGFVLAIWGVDVTGIMAGVSIVTLIVGLGCQSLIQDVVSGLFIVFDDYFAVGDIVIIDGFRGTVHEVGLKTTKLIDAGGNIKSITNSSITTVVNLSREDSLVSVLMDSSYNEDVERVEAVIAQALPAIAKQIPAITQGPFYKGINNFDDGG